MQEKAKRFPTGRLLCTPNAMNHVGMEEMMGAFGRHQRGDWGEVCPEDWRSNDQALRQGMRILSAYDDLTYDENVDAMKYCIQAEQLFELYQTCANRKQIETICLKFLRSLDATKVSVNGHLYFVPRHTMEQVVVFETFIEEVSRLNRNNTPLFANSFYLIDDAKQRDKMTEEFYLAVKKEIAQYQERADYFIQSGCSSPSTMERWVVKIQTLEEKKRRYENILRRELSGLDEEFESLRLLSQELSLRARGIRSRKAA